MQMNRLALAVLCSALVSPAVFADKIQGNFVASKDCEAYQSTKKLNNPDNAAIKSGQAYELIERNKADNPSWYQVRVPDATPAERWVASDCGKADISKAGSASASAAPSSGKSGGGAKCDLSPNIIDSYVFAVSWQPAFCESHSAKPECQIHDSGVYQASHFTLHGLWPNQNSCGTNYGFCGGVQQQKDFCAYPPTPMTPETATKLGEVMPSVASGSCLDRHEWNKHGSCQSRSADEYYGEAMNLLRQFNDSGIAAFIASNVGGEVQLDDFLKKIDESLGAGAHERMKLGCDKEHNLVDIYINLPKDLPTDATLQGLISQGAPGYSSGGCGPTFHVDKI